MFDITGSQMVTSPLDLYRGMLRIRRAEEKIVQLAEGKEISDLVHLSTGQEAVAMGVCAALTQYDYVVSTHRCHAHYLAKGGDMNAMFAELYGKATGCSRGWGGSMHLVDPDVNMMGSSAIVGGSIPIAAGLAWASKLKKNGRVAVAFFGDGAVEEGVFWETLNIAVVHQLPVIFVCENNLYATHSHISTRQPQVSIRDRVSAFGAHVYPASVDGNDVLGVYTIMNRALEFSREGNGPSFIEAHTYRMREHWGPKTDASLGYRTEEEIQDWATRCPLRRLMGNLLLEELRELGSKVDVVSGEFDLAEDDVALEIREAVRFARESPLPDPHDISERFKDEPLLPYPHPGPSTLLTTYKEAVAEAYVQAMEEDPRVVLMGEGVDGVTGIYGTVLPAHARFAIDGRVIDTPLAEGAMTGVAIGMAIGGLRPVLMHQRNDFMLLAADQMINQAAQWTYFTGGRIKVPLVVRVYIAKKPGEGPQHTKSLQSTFAYFPGIKVFTPASAYDAKGMTLTAIRDNGPVIIFEHRDLNEKKGEVPIHPYIVGTGARVAREGSDISLVAHSSAVSIAMTAMAMAQKENISCELIDLRCIRPLDVACLVESVYKTRRLVIVDTGWTMYGVSAEVSASVAEAIGPHLLAPIVRVGAKPVGAPAAVTLEQLYHPSVEDVMQAIRKVMQPYQ